MTRKYPSKRQNQRGVVTLLYTLMMLFIIIPMAGLAIDAGIVYTIKTKLQAAVDGAALAAARSLNLVQDITVQQNPATTFATSVLHANFPTNWMAVNPVADPTVAFATNAQDSTIPLGEVQVTVTETIDAPTWFMRILNFNSVHMVVSGQTTRRNVNIMLVIDRSTSLSDSGSCPALATDSQTFVTNFQDGRDVMGLLTFGSYFHLDFAPNTTFKSSLTSLLSNLNCSGFTNGAAAFWNAYQALKHLNNQNALNIILFFTDGVPNTITFGTFASPDTTDGLPAGTGTNMSKKTSGTTCSAASGPFAGVVAGDTAYSTFGGIFLPWGTAYPAPNFPDYTVINSTYGNPTGSGCSFVSNTTSSNTTTGYPKDVQSLPTTDAYGNSLTTSVLGGTGFPVSVTANCGPSSNQVCISSFANVENAGINTLDNAAQRARVDAAANSLPYVVYTIGLGSGINTELLKRVSNDPSALAYQTTYAAGLFENAPSTVQLNQAFSTIASDILRLSK